MQRWVQDDSVTNCHAAVTDSGWINDFIALRWLTDTFDPATKPHDGSTRLLVLDGAGSHVRVSLMDACEERNIALLYLPSHMSDHFQPLDVKVFNELKRQYHAEMSTHFLRARTEPVQVKAMFWRWHNDAWNKTAGNARLVRSAWRESGLWPYNEQTILGRQETPIAETAQSEVKTPLTDRTSRHNAHLVRSGQLPLLAGYEKLLKAHNLMIAQRALNEKENADARTAEELQKQASGPSRRALYPHGGFYMPGEVRDDAAELAQRRVDEAQAAEQRRQKVTSKKRKLSKNSIQDSDKVEGVPVEMLSSFSVI